VPCPALPRAVFTSDLFATGNDRDNRAAVPAVPTQELDLMGPVVHGPWNAADKALRGARMQTSLNLHSECATAARIGSVGAELSWPELPWQ
jgi:hypothetical protein